MYSLLCTEVLPQLIPVGSKILVAVSGGPDSVALAHILYRYLGDNPEQNLSLVISHVNHKARPEADDEAEFVAKMAEQWGIPFILHVFDAKRYAHGSRKSFQEAAREWRYARWEEDRQKWGCNLLATAHHLGDQAETVLYRLIRGSGTSGLAGIYPSKDGKIRPLLNIPKKEILRYCREENLFYYIDQSNLEPTYVRNKIRLRLLPEIEKNYNERIQEALGRTAEILRWDDEFINSCVERVWRQLVKVNERGEILLDFAAWEQPEAILSRVLRRAAAGINGETRGIAYKFIIKMMRQGRKTGWQQNLPGIIVESTVEGLLFRRGKSAIPDMGKNDFHIALQPGDWHLLPGKNIRVGLFEKMPGEKFPSASNILWWTEVSPKNAGGKEGYFVCRTRMPGDRMYFKKLGHKDIKKVFQENKIAARNRHLLPMIADNNEVIWIPGVSRSDSFIPSSPEEPAFYCIFAKAE